MTVFKGFKMKNSIRILIIFLILFLIITLVTSNFNRSSCGNDTVGFPFTFYTYYGGKMSVEPASREQFNFAFLFFDISIVLIVSILVNSLFLKRRKLFKRF